MSKEWKLVPVELTEAMREAYEANSIAPIGPISKYGYRAMLDAAPVAESQEPAAWGTMQSEFSDDDRTLITDKDEAETYNRQCYTLTPLFTRSDAGEVESLRDELATANDVADTAVRHSVEMQQRLTAAEQRNANLLHTLRSALQGVKMVGLQDHLCDYALAGNIQAEIEAALFHQPTESGASE